MGAVVLTAATSGGAVIPGIMSPITAGRGVQYSFCVVVAVSVFGAVLPLYTAIVPSAKKQVDPVQRTQMSSLDASRNVTSSRVSKAFHSVTRRKKVSPDLPVSRNVEGKAGTWPG